MTDADALSELVRAGLRNPARIVVKVQSKKSKVDKASGEKKSIRGEVLEERRIPAKYVRIPHAFFLLTRRSAWRTCTCRVPRPRSLYSSRESSATRSRNNKRRVS